MSPTEFGEAHARFRLESAVEIPMEVLRRDLIHEVFDGFGDALSSDWMIRQTLSHRGGHGDGGRAIRGFHRTSYSIDRSTIFGPR
jgi:hypothetical protein